MQLFTKSLLAYSLALSSSYAAIELPAFFSDGMVLQQKTGAKIWGTSDKASTVKVSFAGQDLTTKADANGKWMVELKNLTANKTGAELTIASGKDTKLIKNVLVGEVWLASGQSNMEWRMQQTNGKQTALVDKDDLLRVYVSGNATALTPQTDFKGTWKATKPGNTQAFTAVGYEFGKQLRQKLDVPVGIIECAWGGKPVESFISEEAIKALPESEFVVKKKATIVSKYDPVKAEKRYQQALGMWPAAEAKWQETKQGKRPRKPRKAANPALSPALHSTIYNGMIAPIVGYGARGVIWYQGESNAKYGTGNDYGELLECLIQDWRKRWGVNLSFYYVQLANFENASFKEWVIVQDEMRRLLKDSNSKTGHVGMAVINDIGAPRDIHPPNKKDVGARLARWAFHQDYGMKDVVVSGPLYSGHTIKGNSIEIHFDHAKGLKSRGGKPITSFEIADKAGKWHPATATLTGDKVVLSAEGVTPVKARYAWANNPKGATLVNAEGLPTSCFITK